MEQLPELESQGGADDNRLVRELYPYMWELFGRDGWDDPEMESYNENPSNPTDRPG